MIKILLPANVLGSVELSSTKEKLFIDVYNDGDYEKKLLEEFWDIVMGPRKFDSFTTIFVSSTDAVALAIRYLESRIELEEMKKRHEVLYSYAELQGPTCHQTLRELQKLKYSPEQMIVLVAEKGVHLLAYLEYLSAGRYSQVEETVFEVHLDGKIKRVLFSEHPLEGFYNFCIPPLRERKNDIPYMVDWILSSIHQKHKYLPVNFPSEEIMDLFLKYDWPGNTEELIKVVHMCSAGLDVVSYFVSSLPNVEKEEVRLVDYVKKIVETVEKRTIKTMLEKYKWNRKKVASILGLNYKTLCYKIKKYGITRH